MFNYQKILIMAFLSFSRWVGRLKFILITDVFCLFLTSILVGCSHGGIRVNNVDQSLSSIEQIIGDCLPVGKRAVSPNGREFFSDYFVLVENKAKAASRSNLRYYAQVYILGDRRPYTVEGVIRKELREPSRVGSEYTDAGVDEKMTLTLMKKIKAALSKGRGERNVIDDFRVF